MSPYNAAISAGFSAKRAGEKFGHPLPGSVNFAALFERKLMTNTEKVNKVLSGMEATKTIVRHDGTTMEVPDWASRYKYTELMLRLCKDIDAKEKPQDGRDLTTILKEARERVNADLKAMVDSLPGAAGVSVYAARSADIIDV